MLIEIFVGAAIAFIGPNVPKMRPHNAVAVQLFEKRTREIVAVAARHPHLGAPVERVGIISLNIFAHEEQCINAGHKIAKGQC
jgi:hypothetical protein